jgi:hypothetical protein
MTSNPIARVTAILGGLIGSAIGFGYYKFNGGNLEFIRWATEDRLAWVWLIAGIAIGYMAKAKFGGPPSSSA